MESSTDGYEAQVTRYLYDRQYVILETDAEDKLSVRYVRGINYISRTGVTGDAAAQISYFLYNGHGDVVQTVSEDGTVENQYDYDIFGSPTLTIEDTYSSAIRYAGEFYDAESGLIYLRARYYNPYTGRFISEDSYWGEDDRPLSLNRYTYVLNSPLMFWDPTGHWEAGDENLNVYAQIKIIELTNNYYNATTEEDRQRIQAEANGIRNNPSSSEPVHSIIKIPTGAIEEANRLGDETRGYMTAEEWRAAAGIIPVIVDNGYNGAPMDDVSEEDDQAATDLVKQKMKDREAARQQEAQEDAERRREIELMEELLVRMDNLIYLHQETSRLAKENAALISQQIERLEEGNKQLREFLKQSEASTKELEETIAQIKASSKATEEFLEKHKSYGSISVDQEKKKSSYWDDTVDQIILGNYTDKITVAGTAAQIGSSVIGIDLPADVRDLSADPVNWEWTWSHAGQTTLDTLAFLPFLGMFKYTDEAGELMKASKKAKNAEKAGEGVARVRVNLVQIILQITRNLRNS